MSYIASVLSSLGNGSTPAPPPVAAPKPRSVEGAPHNGKRKAEEELRRPAEKVVRVTPKPQNGVRPPPPSQPSASKPLTINTSTTNSPAPKAGTNKPSPVTPNTNQPKVPLKKGSFKEIMARAQQNIAVAPAVGAIAHKPKEKISLKKEMQKQKEMAKTKKKDPASKLGPAPAPGKRSSPGASKSGNGTKVSKPAPPPGSYQGTAKPKPKTETSYKGTARPLPSKPIPTSKARSYSSDPDTRRPAKQSTSSKIKSRHRSYSPSDQSDYGVSDDGYNVESDVSDMDAGFDEVEEEDERAAKEARKEDFFEEMRLKELARQKEARRKRLREEEEREKRARAEDRAGR